MVEQIVEIHEAAPLLLDRVELDEPPHVVVALHVAEAPLTPAPVSPIEQSALPPPSSAPGVSDPTQFPEAPEAPGATSEDGTTEVAAAAGEEISRDSLVGAWKVSADGQSCQMFMALTKWTGGYRAASRGCPGEAANVAAWDVASRQVVLSDSSGNVVARLYASGNERFDGQTTGGQRISLSR